MPRAGSHKVHRYSDEFKLTAVRLSLQSGIQGQTVAAALENSSLHALDVTQGRASGPAAIRLRADRAHS
jgi:transposase-like protein